MTDLLSLDRDLFLKINKAWTSSIMDQFMPVITDLHKNVWFLSLILPLLLMTYFVKFRWAALRSFVALVLLLTITDNFAYRVVKHLVDRPRPEAAGLEPILRTISHSGSSFPSNHATNIFALMTFLALLFPNRAWLCGTFAFVIAYSRIYVGVHYPLDVVVGALIGILWAVLIFWAYRVFENWWRSRELKREAKPVPSCIE